MYRLGPEAAAPGVNSGRPSSLRALDAAAFDRDSFVGALRRQWWIVVAAFVLGLVIGAVPTPKKANVSSTVYDATNTMVLSSNDPSGSIVSDTINVNEISLLAVAGQVPKNVAARLGEPNSALLVTQVHSELDGSTNAFTYTARDRSAERAVLIADTFAEELAKYITTRQDEVREQRLTAAEERMAVLQQDVQTYSKQLVTHPDDRIIQAKLDAATRRYSNVFEEYDTLQGQPRTISLVSLETAEAVPVNSSAGFRAPRSRLARGLFLGLAGAVIGAGLVLLLNLLDPRIRRRSQAEAILGTRAQLSIPTSTRVGERLLAVRRDRNDPIANAYRALRSIISLSNSDREDLSTAPLTLILSSGSGDGKTTGTANLAAAFIETGARTVAVNTDFRRPALAATLSATDLSAVAPEALPNLPLVVSASVPGLRVYDERLQDDDASPSELARKVVRTLPWLRANFEEIVVDSAPVAVAAEILELLPAADTIVVVVRLGHTRIEAATRTAETLRALGVTDFLLVVVGGQSRHDDAYYYGSSTERESYRFGKGVAAQAIRRLTSGSGTRSDGS